MTEEHKALVRDVKANTAKISDTMTRADKDLWVALMNRKFEE